MFQPAFLVNHSNPFSFLAAASNYEVHAGKPALLAEKHRPIYDPTLAPSHIYYAINKDRMWP